MALLNTGSVEAPHIVDQPINHTIDLLSEHFSGNYHINPYSNEGIAKIFGDTRKRDEYIDIVMKEVGNESDRDYLTTQIMNSMKNQVTGAAADFVRSEEGFDLATTPGANQGALDAYNPITILGYNAKNNMLDIYKPLNHKDREYTFMWDIPYAMPSLATSDEEMLPMPFAIRDGRAAGLLNPKKVDLTKGAPVTAPNNVALCNIDGVQVGFAKTGIRGNVITESNEEKKDRALAEDIRVSAVLVDVTPGKSIIGNSSYVTNNVADYSSVFGPAATPADEKVRRIPLNARREVKGYGGDIVSNLIVNFEFDWVNADGTQDSDFINVTINRDNGDYRVTPSTSGRVIGIEFDIPFLNPANIDETVRYGRKVYTDKIVASPRKTMDQGLALDTVMDKFRATGTGDADIVKYVSNEFSKLLAGVNDLDMENHLISNINKCVDDGYPVVGEHSYPASPKLGGFADKAEIDLKLRGPGGDRVWGWLEEGIKDTLMNIMDAAETYTYFEDTVDREWVFIGHRTAIRRFVDARYTTEEGKGREEVGEVRFGFKRAYYSAFSDNFGRRTRFIGSYDLRWKNRGGKCYGLLRSNNPKDAPTALYHGYDFRVIKTRNPNQQNIDAISFWVHDTWSILAMCGARVELLNADTYDLYGKTVENSKTLTVNRV